MISVARLKVMQKLDTLGIQHTDYWAADSIKRKSQLIWSSLFDYERGVSVCTSLGRSTANLR